MQTKVHRLTVDLSGHKNLVVIYLGMRVIDVAYSDIKARVEHG